MICGLQRLATIVGTNGVIDLTYGTSLLIFVIGIAFSAPRVYSSHTGDLLSPHSTLIGMNEIRGYCRCVCSDHEIIG